jgi:hypothetical protein
MVKKFQPLENEHFQISNPWKNCMMRDFPWKIIFFFGLCIGGVPPCAWWYYWA